MTLESALLETNPVYNHPKQTQLPRMINVHLDSIVEFRVDWKNSLLAIKRDLLKSYFIFLL